jgi:hypothetical protein
MRQDLRHRGSARSLGLYLVGQLLHAGIASAAYLVNVTSSSGSVLSAPANTRAARPTNCCSELCGIKGTSNLMLS